MRRSFILVTWLLVGCTGESVDNTTDAGGVDATADVQRDASAGLDSASDATSDATSDAEPDAASDASEARATCATIADAVPGTSTCREETQRCSLTIPATTSCSETCGEMGMQCLRAYNESASCVAAVELEELGCDRAPKESGFCQCGDRNATYDPWVVVTIGDSTMSNNTAGESGWGDELPAFGVRREDVINEGSSGASSLDFETRKNWPRAKERLGPKVFLLIQFGHNDTAPDEKRHTEPGEPPEYIGTYRDRLDFYVAAALAAGATPIIATSMGHMAFDSEGNTRDMDVTRYVHAATRYALDNGLLLIDGHRASRAEYERLGEAETMAQYSFDEITHFTPAGARRLAELMVRLGCIESETFCAQFKLP